MCVFDMYPEKSLVERRVGSGVESGVESGRAEQRRKERRMGMG